MLYEVFTVFTVVTVGLWGVAFHNWKNEEDEAHANAVHLPRFLSAMAMVVSAIMLGISGYIAGQSVAMQASAGYWIVTGGISIGTFIMSATVFWKSTLYSCHVEAQFKRALIAADKLLEEGEPQENMNIAVQIMLRNPEVANEVIHKYRLYADLDALLRGEFVVTPSNGKDDSEDNKQG